MTVPITTVNENDLPEFRENQVRFAWKTGDVRPEPLPKRSGYFPYNKL